MSIKSEEIKKKVEAMKLEYFLEPIYYARFRQHFNSFSYHLKEAFLELYLFFKWNIKWLKQKCLSK